MVKCIREYILKSIGVMVPIKEMVVLTNEINTLLKDLQNMKL